MHLRPGLRPRPRWESLQRSTDPLAGNGGGAREGGGKKRGGVGKGRGGRDGKGRGRAIPRTKILATALIPIPIVVYIQFPFTQESHGNPIPMGTHNPMHTSQWGVKPTIPLLSS